MLQARCKDQVKMRWGVPKQKRHCAAYGGISHQVIIVQKHKDFVIDVGQVIYQHRTIVCAWTREVSSIRPICASPGQSVGAELLLSGAVGRVADPNALSPIPPKT